MTDWITKDPSKTREILLKINRDNIFRYGALPNKLIDFMVKQEEFSIEVLCESMGMIARDIKHYLERYSPHEVGMIANSFSYLGGIPELDPKEVEETKKILESIGVEVGEDGSVNMDELTRAFDNIDSFEKLSEEKDKNNDGS